MTQHKPKTPLEVVDTYLDVLYNQRRLDLIPDLIADPTWRHAPGKISQLTRRESIQRLTELLDLCPVLRFETAVRVVEGSMVTVPGMAGAPRQAASPTKCAASKSSASSAARSWRSGTRAKRPASGSCRRRSSVRTFRMHLHDTDARRRLGDWLSRQLGAEVAVASARRPGGGGWSNETWIVDVSGKQHMRVVVRMKPSGLAMFRDYDLMREYRILDALGHLVHPPVPRVIAIDAHGEVLGRPLFVMRHVKGDIPSDDRPSFAEAGWLYEATPAEQHAFCTSFIHALAGIHAADWNRLGLAFVARSVQAPLRAEIDWYRDLHRWGVGSDLHQTIERGFAAALDALPIDSDACLLWGDARPANVIAVDFRPVALLDWELATIGSPEIDVAWFLEMNRMRTIGSDIAPLPGFLSDEEVVAEYERMSGRLLADLAWHRLFAVLKMAVLMERHLRVAIAHGHLRKDHRLLTDNVALRRLDTIIRGAAFHKSD